MQRSVGATQGELHEEYGRIGAGEAGGASLPIDLAGTAVRRPELGVAIAGTDRARRTLNVLVALIGLIAVAPLMLVVALAIRLTSRGPALFVQTRVGWNRRNGSRPIGDCRRQADLGGKPFRIYKFRTMDVASCNGHDETWTRPGDPRVTRLGAFLRKYRIDELPQLFNVLLGDMNIVGPRPEQPRIFSDLRERIDGYADRQGVRPGITGWAQINYHYGRTIEDVQRKLEFDLAYIRRRSTVEDARIMLRTLPVMLLRRGAW